MRVMIKESVPKFTWGDIVRISDNAPAIMRPGSPAEIVGISEQHQRHGSYLRQFPSGVVYTVEFEDGNDAGVHESYLIRLISDDSSE